ncbi:hypothetical protein HR51_20605 [Burkholderia cepacia]|nr:hypothetical protein HR51_20605 [Burkholderia cepacia]
MPHHRLSTKQAGEWEFGRPAPAQFAVVTESVDSVTWIGRYVTDSNDRRAQFIEGMHRIEWHERALLTVLLERSLTAPGMPAGSFRSERST